MDAIGAQPRRGAARRGIDPSWLPIYVAIGLIAIIFIPLIYVGAILLIAMALNIIRSALVHRQTGWVSGLILGLMLLLPGILALIALVINLVRG